MQALRAGVSAFREEYTSVDFSDPEDFTDVAARQARYALYWALYENTAYRNVHRWAKQYKATYGLYRYVRNIYNPAHRLGEFWSTHLMGGQLDTKAGAGIEVPSCLPIIVPDENQGRDAAIRMGIAALWKASQWQTNKDIFTLWGAVMGDTALQVIDDPAAKRVYLKLVHPSDLTDITFDDFGNVKAYRIDRAATDPENGRKVTYSEIARNDGGTIQYQTLRDNKPYAWNGVAEEWDEPYGFVPLVMVKHQSVGLNYGWSELHPVRSKMHEADDMASALSDQIRKSVNPMWLMAGMNPPSSNVEMPTQTPTATKPEPGREEVPAMYAPDGATATAMIAPLDYDGTLEHLKGILAEIEREYPELRFDNLRVTGDASGRALRIARQPVEAKVLARRANYDDALKRAQQMALSIGGYQKYDGYQVFTLDSYARGELEHTIGSRDVFPISDAEKMEDELIFWQAAGAATSAGLTIEGYLRYRGWTDEQINLALYTGVPER